VALTRILLTAARIITGEPAMDEEQLQIRVITDESGALPLGNANALNNANGGLTGSIGGGVGGGAGLTGGSNRQVNLQNQVRRNVARAKILEAANGRILSFLEVEDLPEVRVNIRLYEVNRNKLKSFNPNSAFVAGTSRGGISVPGGAQPRAPNSMSNEFANILGFIGGALINETQFTSAHFAVDMVLAYLEQQGVARSLASPSLTVLSGEQAQFHIGGEIPVQEAFTPALGTGQPTGNPNTLGVFTSVTFLAFGIQLNIRPLVGDDDTLTIDVVPNVTTPDTDLTAAIRDTTGTNPLTTALKTRSLRTSARLQDGQALLVGGLLSQNTSDNLASTPGVRDVPGLGHLFRRSNRADDGLELVIVVNPAIVRDPLADSSLWQYPELLEVKDAFSKTLPVKEPGTSKN
jgi:Flp pilus assembly secretin CpaC